MLFEEIRKNKQKTVWLILAFVAFICALGYVVGALFFRHGTSGLVVALILSTLYTGLMVSCSNSVVMEMNHGQEVSEQNCPELYHIVSDMALAANIPMPAVYIVEDEAPNAFATGNSPKKAAVAVTTGLLQIMNREELEGVIGHEVSHIRNYDIRVQTIALALSSVVTILVDFASRWYWYDNDEGEVSPLVQMLVGLIISIFGPLAASIAQMAISRNREYLADAGSVELTRNPQGLISALQKLEHISLPTQSASPVASALYFNDIENKRSWFQHLFDTHPSLADRIQRLEQL